MTRTSLIDLRTLRSILKRVARCVCTLILVTWIFAGCVACQRERRPSRYLIPEGYVGWVKIIFKVPAAPALPVENGHYLIRFPSTGVLQTSSDIEYGVTSKDDYYYYSDDVRKILQLTGSGGKGMIWAQHNGESFDSSNRLLETADAFFVGTEDDYREYGCLKDKNYQPEIGPIDKTTARKCGEDR